MYPYVFVLIIPSIVAISSLILRRASGAFWQYSDPCYIYYFNGLHMIKGLPPTNVDHPGTPLQVLIYLIIWVFNIGRSAHDVLTQGLLNPEFYLYAVYFFLLFSSFVTSILLAGYVYHKTNDKVAALLTQLPSLIFLVMPSFNANGYCVLPIVANVSPEPLFISIMNIFNLFFLKLYFSKGSPKELRNVLLLGISCGLGLAIKLNFFPVFVAALIAVAWRRKALFIMIVSVSFVFWTLPIIKQYHKMWGWIELMMSHTSRYGWGGEGFIDWSMYLRYVKYLIEAYWFFIGLAILLLLGSAVAIFRTKNNRSLIYLWAVSVGFLLQCAATAKYFSFHYLVPGLGLFSCGFFLLYLNLSKAHKIVKPLALVFIIAFGLFYIAQIFPYRQKLWDLSQDIRNINLQLHKDYPKGNIITTKTEDINLYFNQEQGLFNGNSFSYHKLDDELLQLYPKSYYFFSEGVIASETDGYGIRNFKKRIFADELLSLSPFYIFLVYKTDFSEYPFRVSHIDKSKYLDAYLLLGSTEKESEDMMEQSRQAYVKGNLQDALFYALRTWDLKYQPRNKAAFLINVIYRQLKSMKQ